MAIGRDDLISILNLNPYRSRSDESELWFEDQKHRSGLIGAIQATRLPSMLFTFIDMAFASSKPLWGYKASVLTSAATRLRGRKAINSGLPKLLLSKCDFLRTQDLPLEAGRKKLFAELTPSQFLGTRVSKR